MVSDTAWKDHGVGEATTDGMLKNIPRRVPHARPPHGVREQLDDRGREGVGIAGRHEEARLAGRDDDERSALTRCDDRPADGHRLESLGQA